MYWEQSLIEQFFSYDKIRSFRVKINNLIKKLGNNYIEEIENDISLLDELS